tara:strand:- start:160 stop:831 length:672 start_codon:yes stop_codon:yes gene_type:complete
MKKIMLIVMFLFAFMSLKTALAGDFYVEAQVGKYNVQDVDTTRASGTVSGITFTDFGGSLEYDQDESKGYEFGTYITDKIRVGFSFTDLSFEFEGANVTGSATDGSNTIDINARVSPADATAVGIQFANDADIMLFKVYYDLNKIGDIAPYIGFSFGKADIENALSNETVFGISAGANHMLSENSYIGVKMSYMEIEGPEDLLGIKYEDAELSAFELIIGTRF